LRINVALLIAAVVAVLVMAISLALFASSRPPDVDSPEAGFARDMIVHHAQALEMAEIVRDKTQKQAIRVLAKEIALTQRGEIGHMQGWLAAWGLPGARNGPTMDWMGHRPGGDMPGMATPEELNHLMAAPSDEADALFLLLMISHHRGAIPMAEAVLDRTVRPEVERLASYMAASQRQETELMRNMLRQEELAPVVVEFRAARDTGVSGTARFAGDERGVEAELVFRNLPAPNAAYLSHIHSGYCNAKGRIHEGESGTHEYHQHGGVGGEVVYPLSPVKPTNGYNGSSTTTLEGVTLDQLFSAEPAYVNVHAAEPGELPQLACANLSVANSRLPDNDKAKETSIYTPR
jgi:uncharacterized protein (DUF305 family)